MPAADIRIGQRETAHQRLLIIRARVRITTDTEVRHGRPVSAGSANRYRRSWNCWSRGMTFDKVLVNHRFQRDDMLTAIEFGALTAGGQGIAPPGPREIPR